MNFDPSACDEEIPALSFENRSLKESFPNENSVILQLEGAVPGKVSDTNGEILEMSKAE